MLRELTERDVAAVESALASEFHALFVTKGEGITALPVSLAALFVEAVGFVTGGGLRADAWLDEWGTTVGNVVLLPRRPLSPDAAIDLRVHEVAHATQFLRAVVSGDVEEGILAPFLWSYVTSPEARARYEADAFGTTLELGVRARGWGAVECRAFIESVVESLRHYALGDGDRELAAQILDARAASLLAGTVSLHPVAASALRTLRRVGAL